METVRKLTALEADYVEFDLHSPCPSYGPSYRVLAAAQMEQRSKSAILIQLDSDAVFLREPDFALPVSQAAARPVDVKGMSTEGEHDPFDPYWHSLCDLLHVDYESLPWVTTTVDRKTVRANYNGGLVAVQRAAGLLQQTERFFLNLAANDRRPWAHSGMLVKSGTGVVDREGSAYWGTSQAAFTLAVTALGASVDILPSSYNVPLHSFDVLPPITDVPVHVHYHWLCSEADQGSNPMTDGRLPVPAEALSWLRGKLPHPLC